MSLFHLTSKRPIYKIAILSLLFLTLQNLNAQEGPNLNDAQGKRHGEWKVNFPGSNQTKFEGTFNHGKETGKFKFYKKVTKSIQVQLWILILVAILLR